MNNILKYENLITKHLGKEIDERETHQFNLTLDFIHIET